MPLLILRKNIAEIECDAIVNSTNNALRAEGYGVDGAISAAAAEGLQKARELLGGCETGKAKYTESFGLPCKYLIHTVGPRWQGGEYKEEEFLASAYTESLRLALSLGCERVAVPLISAGQHGYPRALAYGVASRTIQEFLKENELTVYMALLDEEADTVGRNSDYERGYLSRRCSYSYSFDDREESCSFDDLKSLRVSKQCSNRISEKSLEERLKRLDESFSTTLLRMIDERGMKDSECYKRANIDRRLFSKIRSNPNYRPSKQTAVAFAIALRLSLSETRSLVEKAGFSLTETNEFDIIVEYYIERGKYDIYEINEALFYYDQPLLGAT